MLQAIILSCVVGLELTAAIRHHHFNLTGHGSAFPAFIKYNADLHTTDLSVFDPRTDPQELLLHYITDEKNDMFMRNVGMPGYCEVGRLPKDAVTLLESLEREAFLNHEVVDSIGGKASLSFTPTMTESSVTVDMTIVRRYCSSQNVSMGTFELHWLHESQ
ncbi:uncharacterized protein LOC117336846 [Pecten maximus]|uniref:uncharacterized protein LOC117336846 n=1 Tax=Pecten maximus TaxID=6579 RepID=UPI0014582E0A|nr:uncharacterized protein LOC117336846 [Pecten maximus]